MIDPDACHDIMALFCSLGAPYNVSTLPPLARFVCRCKEIFLTAPSVASSNTKACSTIARVARSNETFYHCTDYYDDYYRHHRDPSKQKSLAGFLIST